MSDKSIFPTSLEKAVENLTDAPTKTVGQTLSDILYLVFGGISYTAEKRKLEYTYRLQEFEATLKQKVNSIPESRQIPPDFQTVGQALNDAKYCLEDETLREMFCSLIASTMDKEKSPFVHPAFSDTIKRMAPLDAKNLLLFSPNKQFPIADIRVQLANENTSFLLMENVFLAGTPEISADRQAFSISTLEALGLVHIDTTYRIMGESEYRDFKKNPFFEALEIDYKDLGEVTIQKKICRLTNYGISFLKVCSPTNI